MKLMINGSWLGDVDPTPELDAQRMIHAGAFRNRGTSGGPSGFSALERYHLYVSYACPFSHRVIIVRALKRLESVVGLSIVHPIWDTPDGWVFAESESSTTDGAGNGFVCLHEAYHASRPDYTGKVTVPVLWDRVSQQIVNNESLEIAQMLNDSFDTAGSDTGVDLYPTLLRLKIDALNVAIEHNLARAVYAVAAARDQDEYNIATGKLFGFLNELEHRLGDNRSFLLGEQVTLADVLAFATLVRFDPVYNPLFRATRRRIVDYPLLATYARRIHDLPGIADTVRFDHILTHYYDGDWAIAARRGIVPDPPAVDYRRCPSSIRADSERSITRPA